MSIGAALVLYAVIWFMCLFVALPFRIRSQFDDGKVVPGTPPSAPVDPGLKTKVKWTTIAATLIWLPIAGIIASGWITIEAIDIFNRWGDGSYG